MNAGSDLALEIRGLSKQYGAVRALKSVDFELRRGEVMGLVGENGAGKSTLIKVLSGIVRPDAGTILIDGETVEIATPSASKAHGIAVVHQEFSLVEGMSVAENIFLGNPASPRMRLPKRQAEQAREYLARVGLARVSPRTEVHELSVPERQLVEIARLVSRSAQILLFDEPTAALAEADTARVGDLVRKLVLGGHSVIYITHHLSEIFAVCDRVTVFRNGESQEPVDVGQIDADELIGRMLGRALGGLFPKRVALNGRRRPGVALKVTNVMTAGLAAPVTLGVNHGEIVGLAGQMGSGASSLLRTIAGAQRMESGAVHLADREVTSRTIREAMSNGIVYCSSDRKADGVFATRPVVENLTAPALRRVTPGGCRDPRREHALARQLADRFQISEQRLRSRAGTLSGGNQQKVALAKLVGVDPGVLLVDEPTRGVDVGARAEIYGYMRTLADRGMSIIFAALDTLEVLGLADRIVTFYRGRLVGTYTHENVEVEQITRDITLPKRFEESVQ